MIVFSPEHHAPQVSQVPRIIALDPGLKGAVAFSVPVSARPMPLAGKDIDLATLAAWVEASAPTLAVIEKVSSMPKQGVVSTFKFGKGYGGLLGICSALRIPVELVTPKRWKSSILHGTPKDKDAAIAYCRRAFPQAELVQPECRKPHDGMADALCLLQFGLREFMKQEVEATFKD